MMRGNAGWTTRSRGAARVALRFAAVSFARVTAGVQPRRCTNERQRPGTGVGNSLVEIDGTAVDDSAAPRGARLVSASAWQSLVPPGEDVEIRVRRGDGRLSRPRTFRR